MAGHHTAEHKLEFIQALRGIAALLVVFYHGVGYQPQAKESGIEHVIFMAGASGVDLFFMISGFIMVYATRHAAGGLDESAVFLIKRVARVFPVYLVATALYVPMMLAMGHYVGHVDIMTEPSQIIRSMLMIPTNFGSMGPYFGGSVLHVGWTINYEIYFYALFALSMVFGRLRWVALAGIALLLLVLLPMMVSRPSFDAYIDYGFNGPLNFATNPMLWEFFIGVVIGRIYLSGFQISKVSAGVLTVIAVALLVWFLVMQVSPKLGLTGWALPYALLLFVLTVGSRTMDLRWPPALVWTGNVSYSLYLVHPFVIHPAYQLLWGDATAEYMNNVWYMLVLAALSLGLAAISHRYLENGLSEWVRHRALALYARLRPRTVPSTLAPDR
ncbi:acyltransferase [Stenotrophomonas sp. PS02289]|uniref:acyltransferase family protein n=1 Tax=Stenotrophomonas sp. PS02289 TaxID=2991422 RepID=UPI00249C80B4|nr:acyltransferase [Stenotrophomonas sp. PS02289]